MTDPISPPWMDQKSDTFVEFNPGSLECQVNVGANQQVTIDKMYGPLVADSVRVRLEYRDDVADWVVESQKIRRIGGESTVTWIERARWPCQEPDDECDTD